MRGVFEFVNTTQAHSFQIRSAFFRKNRRLDGGDPELAE
jgi:hypothetical protein